MNLSTFLLKFLPPVNVKIPLEASTYLDSKYQISSKSLCNDKPALLVRKPLLGGNDTSTEIHVKILSDLCRKQMLCETRATSPHLPNRSPVTYNDSDTLKLYPQFLQV